MQLSWRPSASASALYLVDCLFSGKVVLDDAQREALTEPTRYLTKLMQTWRLHWTELRRHLLPLSATLGHNEELAKAALTKAIGSARAAAETRFLAGAIAGLEAALARVQPNLEHDLGLRVGPIQEQWEARAAGFLKIAANLTDADAMAACATVHVVSPVTGGGGLTHINYNCITLEAVLANPHVDLPETVRLGWLLSCLNLDLPKFQREMNRDRLEYVGPLAMVPVALAAANDVEWCKEDPGLLARAMEVWHLPVHDKPHALETLARWWEVHRSSRHGWEVSLAALEKMLGPA